MPKRGDVRKILIIGSGPIQIGQAAEFDFSGSQACRAVREEGYQVVLVNSNPATIQTDVETAEAVYVEPLTVESLTAIIAKERPDGVLAGMGGQTALNLVSELAEAGVLSKFGVKLLGTPLTAIEDAEDRDLFKKVMERIGEPVAKADVAQSIDDALRIQRDFIGRYPVLVRPAYTLGGLGGGVAHNDGELKELVAKGLAYSRIRQVLIEESLLGWLEFEYEVMRDGKDNCIIICNMENLDPMGVHTGESIVVAPSQTLSDQDHQKLRSSALKCIRALKIEGGCNVQFALQKATGDYRVIEVNPRVSRSSALASKATGYPIARVAAKIALGMTLDEIPNAITGKTVAAFEPTLDYVVTKIPRWPFDKFRTVDPRIGTQMKSTGEVMAIGRCIEESLLKAVRSLEIDADSLDPPAHWDDAKLEEAVRVATHQRLFAVAEALRRGWPVAKVHDLSGYDPFFLHKIANVLGLERKLAATPDDAALLAQAKHWGFSDSHLARLLGHGEDEAKVATFRRAHGIVPDYKMVDTCAAEFEARTPYYYTSYEPRFAGSTTDFTDATEPKVSVRSVVPAIGGKKKVLVLGSGPIRIGQGIEFDYCCVHAAWAIREEGMEAILLNNNPETVSTDFDTSDRLYFEPLTLEDVMHCIERERPDGVLVQFGGQTAINLALPLEAALAARPDLPTRIWGTQPAAIDLAEDRDKFNRLMQDLGIPQPAAGIAFEAEEAVRKAAGIGYPVLVRPSYVLGGRAMQVVHNEAELRDYIRDAVRVSRKTPVLIDRFLARAIEIDVDAVCDGKDVLVGAIMEHVEEAGVHSGDSTTVIPTQNVAPETLRTLDEYTRKIALALGTRGLINIQFAVQGRTVYVLEANPRSSRTVPYVAKATGLPLAKVAAKVAVGRTIAELNVPVRPRLKHVAVKAPVFPFLKLPGVDAVLGPEMKSTGEVMGIAMDYPTAYAKAMEAAGNRLPVEGTVFVSVAKQDRPRILGTVEQLGKMGFELVATAGTADDLRAAGLQVTTVYKVSDGKSPDAIDLIRQGKVQLIINTPSELMEGPQKRDGFQMRRVAVECQVPFLATIEAAQVAVQAIAARRRIAGPFEVRSLQEYAAAR
ncbi:MAG: carbamoyl-phosphate synthase large subunit [Thermoplasmata archaeon]|jgi:carbamoyl-phosphate synthase large subunit|nr:carbamoyl-phosphate synthase large subunit [Thermoplasmata archaeon]